MDGNSFVVYRSYYNTYLKIKQKDPESANAFMDAILCYGFTGETPDVDSDIWVYGLDTIFAQIDASTSNYARAKNSNGGRPGSNISADQIYELMETHKTWKSIAQTLNIDEDTLRRLRNQYNITERTPTIYRKTEKVSQQNRKTEKPTEKPTDRKAAEPKNLNYNYNYNQNLNYNLLENPHEETEKPNKSIAPTPIISVNTIEEKTEKTEKPSNNVFRFPTEKTLLTILQQKTVTELEADRIITESDLPLYREGNKIYSEIDDQEWEIK